MSAQMGRNLLVKIGDGGSPENFVTVAGLRATTLAFNAQSIDITDNASTGLCTFIASAGASAQKLMALHKYSDQRRIFQMYHIVSVGVWLDAASRGTLIAPIWTKALRSIAFSRHCINKPQ